jgi:hypothetical protein
MGLPHHTLRKFKHRNISTVTHFFYLCCPFLELVSLVQFVNIISSVKK